MKNGVFPEKITKEFLKNCGEIIRIGLDLENDLEFFISNYFIYPQNEKTFFLEDLIIQKLNFDKKINLFKKICKKEGVNIDNLIKDVREIQNIRNKVAHREASIDSSENCIKLNRRESIKYKKDELKITSELVEKLRKKKNKCRKEIFSILDKIHENYGQYYKEI